ncbi:hypothetical protein [Dactylosporangium salmoneum]|uniref:Uncharacterized protein n=1 Tax=Dactylosporangium salmoneum TaxID=53361 RepID=A0ABN3FCP5_9ACTN
MNPVAILNLLLRSFSLQEILAVWGVGCLLAMAAGLGIWVLLEDYIARPAPWSASKPASPTPPADLRRAPRAGRHTIGHPDHSRETRLSDLLEHLAIERAAAAAKAEAKGTPDGAV